MAGRGVMYMQEDGESDLMGIGAKLGCQEGVVCGGMRRGCYKRRPWLFRPYQSTRIICGVDITLLATVIVSKDGLDRLKSRHHRGRRMTYSLT